MRLSSFTDSVYPQGSFYFSALLRAGDVRVNGLKTRADIILNAGDEVAYYTTPKMEAKPSHSCIYADEYIYPYDYYYLDGENVFIDPTVNTPEILSRRWLINVALTLGFRF